MYDSHKNEALTKSNILFQPDPIETVNMASELVDVSLHPRTTPPLTNTSSSCCSNCTKCSRYLGILSLMQKPHSAKPSLNVDYKVSINALLVQGRDSVQV